MYYICDTGDEKLDAMLRVLLEHMELEQFRGTPEDNPPLLFVTERPPQPDDRYTAVIVLYSDDRYTYSGEHRNLSLQYGEKYRAVLRPVDLAGFCRVVREIQGDTASSHPISRGGEDGERVMYENRTVSFRGRTVKLTVREDELFRLMYEHRGQVVSRDRISAAVWGNSGSPTSTNVTDVYMSYLRRKLTTVLGDGVLSSVRGEGYILKMPTAEEMIGTR